MRIFRSRIVASAMAILYFTGQVALGSATESNFWSDRKNQSLKLAALPVGPLPALPIISSALSSKSIYELTQREPRSADTTLNHVLVSIPTANASVQEIFQGTGAPVVLIQDVHLNAEAQTNIAATLQSMIDRRVVAQVGVEGAFETFDFSPFRSIPDIKIRRDVSSAFLEHNLLAAPSYVGITSTVTPPPFFGVDDRTEYDRNVQAYLNSRETKVRDELTLTHIQKRITEEKLKMFSADLRQLDDARIAYADGETPLGVYLRQLNRALPINEPVLQRFLEAYDLERKMDFQRVTTERQNVVKKLANVLDERDTNDLIKASLEYRAGQMGFGAYNAMLSRLCTRKNISLNDTPAFKTYLQYVQLADGLSARNIEDAMSTHEARAFARFTRTPAEQQLLACSSHATLTKKLLAFSLTPAEWTKYRSFPRLATEFTVHESFYEHADTRSKRMLLALQSHESDQGASVLVSGGFHTPEIAKLLKERKQSYIVVAPKITKIETSNGSDYLSVFAREKSPLDNLFEGEKLFLSPRFVHTTESRGGLPPLAAMQSQYTGNNPTRVHWKGKDLQIAVPDEITDIDSYRPPSIADPVLKLFRIDQHYPRLYRAITFRYAPTIEIIIFHVAGYVGTTLWLHSLGVDYSQAAGLAAVFVAHCFAASNVIVSWIVRSIEEGPSDWQMLRKNTPKDVRSYLTYFALSHAFSAPAFVLMFVPVSGPLQWLLVASVATPVSAWIRYKYNASQIPARTAQHEIVNSPVHNFHVPADIVWAIANRHRPMDDQSRLWLLLNVAGIAPDVDPSFEAGYVLIEAIYNALDVTARKENISHEEAAKHIKVIANYTPEDGITIEVVNHQPIDTTAITRELLETQIDLLTAMLELTRAPGVPHPGIDTPQYQHAKELVLRRAGLSTEQRRALDNLRLDVDPSSQESLYKHREDILQTRDTLIRVLEQKSRNLDFRFTPEETVDLFTLRYFSTKTENFINTYFRLAPPKNNGATNDIEFQEARESIFRPEFNLGKTVGYNAGIGFHLAMRYATENNFQFRLTNADSATRATIHLPPAVLDEFSFPERYLYTEQSLEEEQVNINDVRRLREAYESSNPNHPVRMFYTGLRKIAWQNRSAITPQREEFFMAAELNRMRKKKILDISDSEDGSLRQFLISVMGFSPQNVYRINPYQSSLRTLSRLRNRFDWCFTGDQTTNKVFKDDVATQRLLGAMNTGGKILMLTQHNEIWPIGSTSGSIGTRLQQANIQVILKETLMGRGSGNDRQYAISMFMKLPTQNSPRAQTKEKNFDLASQQNLRLFSFLVVPLKNYLALALMAPTNNSVITHFAPLLLGKVVLLSVVTAPLIVKMGSSVALTFLFLIRSRMRENIPVGKFLAIQPMRHVFKKTTASNFTILPFQTIGELHFSRNPKEQIPPANLSPVMQARTFIARVLPDMIELADRTINNDPKLDGIEYFKITSHVHLGRLPQELGEYEPPSRGLIGLFERIETQINIRMMIGRFEPNSQKQTFYISRDRMPAYKKFLEKKLRMATRGQTPTPSSPAPSADTVAVEAYSHAIIDVIRAIDSGDQQQILNAVTALPDSLALGVKTFGAVTAARITDGDLNEALKNPKVESEIRERVKHIAFSKWDKRQRSLLRMIFATGTFTDQKTTLTFFKMLVNEKSTPIIILNGNETDDNLQDLAAFVRIRPAIVYIRSGAANIENATTLLGSALRAYSSDSPTIFDGRNLPPTSYIVKPDTIEITNHDLRGIEILRLEDVLPVIHTSLDTKLRAVVAALIAA